MSPLIQMWLLTALAGAAIPVGGVVACFEHVRPRWLQAELQHAVIAFGGGALLSAVALVLIPDGMERLSVGSTAIAFVLGGLAFFGLQTLLDRSDSNATQLVAMLSDFIPEVIAVGATIATKGNGALVLAAMIALQNLPEGFNAFAELRRGAMKRRTILLAFVAIAASGPLLGTIGYVVLQSNLTALAFLQVFASAGILYLVFQDVAPQAKLDNARGPALGAIAGFLLGMIGHQLAG